MDDPPTDTTGSVAQPGFHRFVAIGDSTTEGLDDPNQGGGYRGWADRLAERLAGLDPELRYANLAVRGRYVSQVRSEQLGPALQLRPDLASVIAGVNDLLRARCDIAEVIGHLESMYAGMTTVGATVFTITQPDPVGVPRLLAEPIKQRLRAYNRGLRAAAARHGVLVVDFACLPAATHPLFWSEDRLHLNALGHTRMAATIAEALGLPARAGDPGIGDDAALPAPPVLGRRVALENDAAWVASHLAPWVWRQVRGRSSGDGITAKRPELSLLGLPQVEMGVPTCGRSVGSPGTPPAESGHAG